MWGAVNNCASAVCNAINQKGNLKSPCPKEGGKLEVFSSNISFLHPGFTSCTQIKCFIPSYPK